MFIQTDVLYKLFREFIEQGYEEPTAFRMACRAYETIIKTSDAVIPSE
jgi:hypothetical protein